MTPPADRLAEMQTLAHELIFDYGQDANDKEVAEVCEYFLAELARVTAERDKLLGAGERFYRAVLATPGQLQPNICQAVEAYYREVGAALGGTEVT